MEVWNGYTSPENLFQRKVVSGKLFLRKFFVCFFKDLSLLAQVCIIVCPFLFCYLISMVSMKSQSHHENRERKRRTG